MSRRYIKFPVIEKHKDFCDFMDYPFLYIKNEFFVYDIPHNHLCRFLINYALWIQGTFDKEEFNRITDI